MKREKIIKRVALLAVVLALSTSASWGCPFCDAIDPSPGKASEKTTPPNPPQQKEDPEQKPFAMPPSAKETGIAPESPFLHFRDLLKLSSSECEEAVAEYPDKMVEVIKQKVKEYKMMPLQQRERQLQILDLRWYLFCGVDIQEDKLEGYVQSVPSNYQEIIRERLERWFSMPESYRTNILEDMKKFVSRPQMRGGGRHPDGPGGDWEPGWKRKGPGMGQKGEPQPPPPGFGDTNSPVPPPLPPQGGPGMGGKGRGQGGPGQGMGPGMGPGPEKGFGKGMGRRGGMDPAWGSKEKRIWMELNNFFSMNHDEREKVLNCLPQESRERTWKVMRMLDELPPVERQNSLKILLRISELDQEQRASYLQSAERWKSLSSDEKKFFRILFMPSAPLPEPPPLPNSALPPPPANP